VVPDTSRPVRQFAVVVAIVAAIDLLAKGLAGLLLARRIPLVGPLDLALTYNTGSVLGISLGAYTGEVNVVATFAALCLTIIALRGLHAIDSRAPMALGLIGGAALGNLTSLLVPPAGVTDFLSVRLGSSSSVVMNLADLAVYAGVAMLGRSVLLLNGAIAAQRAGTARTRPAKEREVAIPILVDGVRPRPRAAHDGVLDRPNVTIPRLGDARDATGAD
jgi:lipoprotein signal peptidase